jgi:m7GpppX diphosphatase
MSTVLGHFQEAGAAAVQALVKLVRQPLPTDDVQALISAVALQSRAPYRCAGGSVRAAARELHGSIAPVSRGLLCSGMEYGYFQGTTPRYGMLSVDVLCPDAIRGATAACSFCVSRRRADMRVTPADDAISAEQRASLLAKHITRSTAQASHLVRETPAAYAAVHAPVIAALPPSALGWVYKILAKEKEVERLLCDVPGEDGFVLNVDPKVRCAPCVQSVACA